MILTTIDPGVRTGIAIFDKGELRHCGLLKYDSAKVFAFTLTSLFQLMPPDKVVVEIPRIYDRRNWKGDPNDLILVAKIAGIAMGQSGKYCPAEEVYPQQWKGQRPKDVDNEYTKKILNPEELKVLYSEYIPKTYIHNVIDAIGIGLWKLERR